MARQPNPITAPESAAPYERRGRTSLARDAEAMSVQPGSHWMPHTSHETTTSCPATGGQRAPSWTDCFDPRRPEAFLAFCSLWCSMQMLFWPDQFATENAFVATSIGLRGHEQSWAIFGIVTALLKLVGLASRLSPRWSRFAAGLLASGLFMSIVFWMIVGLSRMVDSPHSITPFALTVFAIAAAWQLADWRPTSEAGR